MQFATFLFNSFGKLLHHSTYLPETMASIITYFEAYFGFFKDRLRKLTYTPSPLFWKNYKILGSKISTRLVGTKCKFVINNNSLNALNQNLTHPYGRSVTSLKQFTTVIPSAGVQISTEIFFHRFYCVLAKLANKVKWFDLFDLFIRNLLDNILSFFKSNCKFDVL